MTAGAMNFEAADIDPGRDRCRKAGGYSMNVRDLPPADPAYDEAVSVLERLASVRTPTRKKLSEPPSVLEEPEAELAGLVPGELDSRSSIAVQNWSEQTLRSLVEMLPDAVAVIDQQGRIVLVNEQTELIFGYKRTEMLGWPIELLIPERFRPGHVGHRNGYFGKPKSRPMGAKLELFGRRKDGAEFPVEISLSPLPSERGTLATSVIRDISARKRAEAKFRTLVENIPAVTFIAPLDESVPELYVSPQIEQLLGFSQKEWLEDPVLWYRQLHPEDRERWNGQFAPTCASGKPFDSIYRFIAKDGRVVWVHGSASVVRDADGMPSFLQGVAFDITSIREAEAALRKAQEGLRRSNVELERRVQERTEELARSMAELQEKTGELEQFAYVASHDLREPLRSLVNYPEKLAKNYGGKIDAQADEWINKTIAGATRMRRLIEDLSVYSRAVRSDQKFQPIECSVAVGEACSNLQAAIDECEAEIVVNELPAVRGNGELLILLFQNLIGNAVKFRDADRSVRVEVGSRRETGDWLFWVRDNGIGIDAKYLTRIFGLGQRLHSTKQYAGTGFGLAICEKIVARHGGHIWAESEPGRGSTFLFTLPAQEAPSP
jgi:PAS domain S-box-containing protein